MENIKKINFYPANLEIVWDNADYSTSINYDGDQGEFTRDEWRQQLKAPVGDGGYGIQLDEDVEEILRALEMTSNTGEFFKFGEYEDDVIDVIIQDEIEFMKELCNLSTDDELLREFNFEEFIGCQNINRLFNISMVSGCIFVEIAQYPKEENGYIQVSGYRPYIEYSIEETREVIENMADNSFNEEEALRNFYEFLDEDDEAKKKCPTFDEYKENYDVISSIEKPSNNEKLYEWGDYYIWYSGDNPRVYTLIIRD